MKHLKRYWFILALVAVIGAMCLPRWWRYHHLSDADRWRLDHITSKEYRQELLNEAKAFANDFGPHLTKGEVASIVEEAIAQETDEFWQAKH